MADLLSSAKTVFAISRLHHDELHGLAQGTSRLGASVSPSESDNDAFSMELMKLKLQDPALCTGFLCGLGGAPAAWSHVPGKLAKEGTLVPTGGLLSLSTDLLSAARPWAFWGEGERAALSCAEWDMFMQSHF